MMHVVTNINRFGLRQCSTRCKRISFVVRQPTQPCCLPYRNEHRGFFNVRKENDISNKNVTTPNDINTVEEKLKRIDESTTTVSSVSSKSQSIRDRIWEYTKQSSSKVYNTIKESTKSSLEMLGTRISTSISNNSKRLQDNITRTIDTSRARVSQQFIDTKESIRSNITENSKLLYNYSISPFRYGYNTIVHIWQTTPIWNRFFWWSLSAIAVYGLATTLPKEIIKYIMNPSISSSSPTPPPSTTSSSPPPPSTITSNSNINAATDTTSDDSTDVFVLED